MIVVVAGLVLALVGVLASAAGAQHASAAARFEFAAIPGTSAWASLPDHKAMEEATQIPRAEAQKMTTEELVDLVVRYPLFRDALAFNSVQDGFEVVASRFNGLTELLARPDAGAALLARYRTFPIAVAKDASLAEAGDHTYEVWKLETLLAQPSVLAHLSTAQLDELLEVGQEKFAAKQANEDLYGIAGLEPTATLLGRGLATRQGVAWESTGLVADGISWSNREPFAVLATVRRHLSPDIGKDEVTTARPPTRSVRDYNSTVTTPNGSSVQVIVRDWELTPAQIASNNQWVETNYPSATRETNASRKYNCHSYAWYSTSTSNSRWMNQHTAGGGANLSKYWTDGSYTFWHPPYIIFSNMRVFWSQGDHSGIAVGTSTYVRSKWGQLPRMYHARTYSPYVMGSGPPPYVIGQGMNEFFRS